MNRVYIRMGEDVFSIGVFEASYGWSGKMLHPRMPFNKVVGYNGEPEEVEIRRGTKDYNRLIALFGDDNEVKQKHIISEKEAREYFKR